MASINKESDGDAEADVPGALTTGKADWSFVIIVWPGLSIYEFDFSTIFKNNSSGWREALQ